MTVLGILRKIVVSVNFTKFQETLKKHKHKKTSEKVRRNYFTKIFLKLRKYVPQINVRIFERKLQNFENRMEKISVNCE